MFDERTYPFVMLCGAPGYWPDLSELPNEDHSWRPAATEESRRRALAGGRAAAEHDDRRGRAKRIRVDEQSAQR